MAKIKQCVKWESGDANLQKAAKCWSAELTVMRENVGLKNVYMRSKKQTEKE